MPSPWVSPREGRGDEGWGLVGAFVYVRVVSVRLLCGGIALALALSHQGRGDGAGNRPCLLALSLRGRDAGRGVCPHPGPFPREGEGTWRVLRPASCLLLVPPLSREMSLPCKAVTPVLASRMPTSIARRHWGCSPSSNFPGRLTGPCGTACVSRLDLPPAKASGCAGYGPPGRPRVRTWNGGGTFGTASSCRDAGTQSGLLIPRGPRPNNSGGMNAHKFWQRWLCARLEYVPSGRLQTSTAVLAVSRGAMGQFGGNFRDEGECRRPACAPLRQGGGCLNRDLRDWWILRIGRGRDTLTLARSREGRGDEAVITS